MARPYRLVEIQEAQGDLHELIPRLVNEFGSQRAAADYLGVSQFTISTWLRSNGYVSKTVYYKPINSENEVAS